MDKNPNAKVKALTGALTTIKTFVENKKPETLDEGRQMLVLVGEICAETLTAEVQAS
jgi:hypothetical protein